MNQSKRNIKNKKYNENLVKRNGITKYWLYIVKASKGVPVGKKVNALKHEFKLTRRSKGIVTREVLLFEWSKVALQAKTDCKLSKEKYTCGIDKPIKPVLTKENYREVYKSEKTVKAMRFESIPFSSLHNKLVNEKKLSTAERISKAKKLQEEHDKLILKDIEMRRTLGKRKPKKCGLVPYLIRIVCENSKKSLYDYETIPIDAKYRSVLKTASTLNKEFSKKRVDYHHLAVVDNKTKEVLSVHDKLAA